MTYLTIIILSVLMVGLAFAAIAVKVLFKKGGRFAGSCSSNNPMMVKEGIECPVCGAKPEEVCNGK